MNIQHQASIWQDAALYEQPAGRKRRSSAPGSAKYILFSIFGTIVAIVNPTLLVLLGIGMSRQDGNVAWNGALASLFAIIFSLFFIRRLLRFPLLRTYGYVALTFATSFSMMAIFLRFFRIDFSKSAVFPWDGDDHGSGRAVFPCLPPMGAVPHGGRAGRVECGQAAKTVGWPSRIHDADFNSVLISSAATVR
jgi:hypothetical protein